MILRNISPKKVYLSWIGVCGKWLLPTETIQLKDDFISDDRLKTLVERNILSIIEYDSSVFSIATQAELSSVVEPEKGEFLKIDKDSNDSIIKVLKADSSIVSIAIKIDIPFDGNKSFSVGIPSNHSLFVAATDIDISKVETYLFSTFWTTSVQNYVNLYTSGVSTQGEGYVYVVIL